uniref:Uncharacterized protein n=1 Tax=Amazona collaria TaxID=241587 RepID=A0A8B9FPA0_9PSIT
MLNVPRTRKSFFYAAVKFVKLACSYEKWDVFASAVGFVVNFLQAQDDPTWKKAEMELKLLTLMQSLRFPRKFKHGFSVSESNTKEAKISDCSEKKQTFMGECLFMYILLSIITLFFSFQNIQPDEEILVGVIMFLWQKCKSGLQQIQMNGNDYLKYIHEYKAYQVFLYYNLFLLI